MVIERQLFLGIRVNPHYVIGLTSGLDGTAGSAAQCHVANTRFGTEELMPRLSTPAVCALMLFAHGDVFSQAYPSRPIRLIVPSAPGGAPDITSRRIANELS